MITECKPLEEKEDVLKRIQSLALWIIRNTSPDEISFNFQTNPRTLILQFNIQMNPQT